MAMDWRLIRCGLAVTSTISSAPCAAGSTQDGLTSTSLSGTATCSPMATAVATATGQRSSPWVARRHAGSGPCRAVMLAASCSHSPGRADSTERRWSTRWCSSLIRSCSDRISSITSDAGAFAAGAGRGWSLLMPGTGPAYERHA